MKSLAFMVGFKFRFIILSRGQQYHIIKDHRKTD